MNTNTAQAFETDTVKTVTFAGIEMTLCKALAVMRAGGWTPERIDAWKKRHVPEVKPEAPEAVETEAIEEPSIEAPEAMPETTPEAPAIAPEAEPVQEQAEAPAIPAAWQARALALKQKQSQETVTEKTDTPKMKTGDWFTIELCYSDRLRLTIAEETGSKRGLFGVPGSSVPEFYAYDENGAKHEVCEHDIDRPGIGGLTALSGIEPSTEEERAALAEKGKQAKEQARIKRENTEREREEKRAAIPAKYPMLKTVTETGKSGAVLGSANIKRELIAAFPGVKFSVRAEHYTSIDISWNDGPTTSQVETVTAKYQKGRFDGMTDSYDFNHDNVFPDVFGGAQYVFNNRHMSIDGMRRAWQLAGHDPAEIKADEHGNWDNWKDEEYTRRAMSDAYNETDLREQAEAKPQETNTVKSDAPETQKPAEAGEAVNAQTYAQDTVTENDTKADESPIMSAIDNAIIESGLFSDGEETFLTSDISAEERHTLRRLVLEMAGYSYTGPNTQGFEFAARGLAAMGKDAAYALLKAWEVYNVGPVHADTVEKTVTPKTVTGCEPCDNASAKETVTDSEARALEEVQALGFESIEEYNAVLAGKEEARALEEKAMTLQNTEAKETATHTSGTWLVTENENGFSHDGLMVYVERAETENTCANPDICKVYQIDGDNSQTRYANARLISAAPKLLYALKGALSALRKALPHINADSEDSHYVGEWIDECCSEIAKATGKA